jgi:WD40 repeat protein/serine/threonine protein kinase
MVLTTAPNAKKAGELLDGKYQIESQLGEGGMGIVYLATHLSDGAKVAVKFLSADMTNDSTALARFQREARLLARLKHPNILTLHGYGVDREPYIAMDYISGGDLNSLLRSEYLENEVILQLIEQIASALDYAHQQGVIHRDVKPGNVLLDEHRNAILADFGLARGDDTDLHLTHSGVLIGTPVYMAPELAGDGQLTSSVDLYALGCILYQLLTNELPFHADTTMGYILQQLNAERPDVRRLRPDLPSGASIVLQKAIARAVTDRYPTGAALVRAFRDALANRGDTTLEHAMKTLIMGESIPSPFKGLEAFQEADAPYFFGREALVQQLIDVLSTNNERFLAIMGGSGSGKSSLVRAGLVPRLRRGDLPDSDQWPIVVVTPGAFPLKALATQLLLFTGVSDLAEQVEADPTQLDVQLRKVISRQKVGKSGRVVLVLDQFEEVFTRASDTQRDHFLAAILHCATVADGPTIIILTMRADFYHRVTGYSDPRLTRLFQNQQVIARPLTPSELRHAIEAPATVAGLHYESGLVETILTDVGVESGSLPLLQYALQELYKGRKEITLSRDIYALNGGVHGALARRAEQLYESLDVSQQALMRRILLRLVEVNEAGEITRRRVERDHLTFDNIPDEAVEDIVLRLTHPDVRLLTANREWQSGVEWIDVSHEALIQRWDRLRGWVRENLAGLLLSGNLLRSAQDWEKSGRDPDFLLRGIRLDEAMRWLGSSEADALPIQRELIHASTLARQEEHKQRDTQRQRELELERDKARQAVRARNFLRALLVAAGIFIIVAIGLSVFAFVQAKAAQAAQAASERKAAEVHSLALADSAQKALDSHNDDLAMALAVEANHIENPPLGAVQVFSQVADSVGTIRQLIGHSDWVSSVAYSPDGKTAVSGAWDNTLILWNLATGKPIRTLTGHIDHVSAVAFSPDGKTIASASWDRTVMLWDVASGAAIHTLRAHRERVTSVAFSPDGKQLLSGAWDGTAILWDVAQGQVNRELTGHTDKVSSVAFSPNGLDIVTGSWDNTLILWETATGRMIFQYRGHKAAVLSVAFAPDNTAILSGGADHTLRLWNIAMGSQIREYDGHTNNVTSVAFSPDSKIALSGSLDGTVRMWNVETGVQLRLLAGHTAGVLGVAYSSDSKTVLSASGDRTLRLWDVEIKRLVGHTRSVNAVKISPNGKLAVSSSTDRTLRVWDLTTLTQIQEFDGHTDVVEDVDISPDGQTVLSVGDDHNAILWDIATGKEIRRFTGHQAAILTVAFSPDGKFAVTGSATPKIDKSLILWDVATGKEIRRFDGHTDSVQSVVFTPDGKTILSGSWDGSLILWDVATGNILRRFTGHKGKVWSVAISPDGQTVASGSTDNTIRLWSIATGEQLTSLQGHVGAVYSVVFTPDGRNLLSGSDDHSIRLWDVTTGIELRSFEGHPDTVWAVAISPDGKTALSASEDTTIHLWQLSRTAAELLSWVDQNRYVRDFSCTERQTFFIEPQCEGTTASLVAPTLTPAVTAVSVESVAHAGDNSGAIAVSGSQIWTYRSSAGEAINLVALADKPANGASVGDIRKNGLFDTVIIVRDKTGKIIAQNDDSITQGTATTNAQIKRVFLPSDGQCFIEVRGFNDESGGSYTLIVTVLTAPTPTPTATLKP